MSHEEIARLSLSFANQHASHIRLIVIYRWAHEHACVSIHIGSLVYSRVQANAYIYTRSFLAVEQYSATRRRNVTLRARVISILLAKHYYSMRYSLSMLHASVRSIGFVPLKFWEVEREIRRVFQVNSVEFNV